jgi:hypothetical protein
MQRDKRSINVALRSRESVACVVPKFGTLSPASGVPLSPKATSSSAASLSSIFHTKWSSSEAFPESRFQ